MCVTVSMSDLQSVFWYSYEVLFSMDFFGLIVVASCQFHPF